METKCFIYGLRCPTTEKIGYIGKSVNPHVRYLKRLREKNDFHNNRLKYK